MLVTERFIRLRVELELSDWNRYHIVDVLDIQAISGHICRSSMQVGALEVRGGDAAYRLPVV